MTIPQFTVTGKIEEYKPGWTGALLFANKNIVFTPNIKPTLLVVIDGVLRRVDPVVAQLTANGTLYYNGTPGVPLLANDVSLGLAQALQWEVSPAGDWDGTERFEPWWFLAGNAGETVDIAATAKAPRVTPMGYTALNHSVDDLWDAGTFGKALVRAGNSSTALTVLGIASGVQSVAGKVGVVTLNKTDVGLANVDNSSDAGKPVSNATQAALDLKQNALGYTAENTANKNQVNGYAGLDGTGTVAAAQLPSYVDDVLEFTNLAGFPATGATGKIFVALDTNKTYRWSGSVYIEISPSPGSTDAVIEGSVNKYYTDARASAAAPVQSVASKTGAVTLVKGDVGLGSVDNTADVNKNVLSATKLTTARNINGVSFDGTSNITVADSTKAIALTATAVKTGAYAANANELVPADATSSGFTVTVPTAPAAGTRIAVKKLDSTANVVTVAAGGTDKFNTATGSASVALSLQFHAAMLQYASGIWYVTSTDIPLAGLDARYQATINSGTLPLTALSVTGTADSSHFLRGDGAWSVPAGAGDTSTNTSTSVDGEVVLFSGTGGKTLQRATGTGIATVVAGVHGTVAAPSGAVVGTTDTQTLTNKTISGASNTLSAIGVSSLSATGTKDATTFLRGDNTWAASSSPSDNEYIGTTSVSGVSVPAGVRGAWLTAIGVGGAGGSGRRGAAASVRSGGTGGGGGAMARDVWIPVAQLGATFAVTIPAAPTGGAARTVDSTDGSPGSTGSNVVFTSGSTTFAVGPGGAGAGGATSAVGGGAGGIGYFQGANGATSSNGGAGGAGGFGDAMSAGGGGGSGAGLDGSNVASNGGAGGNAVTHGLTGGTGGVTGGASPTSGAAAVSGVPGAGAGGGASGTAAGQAGANGVGYGAGGGGGAASLNGFASGAGGNGGPGYLRIKWGV